MHASQKQTGWQPPEPIVITVGRNPQHFLLEEIVFTKGIIIIMIIITIFTVHRTRSKYPLQKSQSGVEFSKVIKEFVFLLSF